MTVSYNLNLSTSKPWALFRILLRWRGSIWKVMLIELAVFYAAYTIVNAIFTFALPTSVQISLKKIFHELIGKNLYKTVIPLEFMLGFFVTAIVNRWTSLLNNIGFIDSLALTVSEYVRGNTEQIRIVRRNIVRYCCLAQVLVFRDISVRIRKRFPTLDTVVAAGLMLPHEKEKYEASAPGQPKYWMPFQWSLALVYKCRKASIVESDVFCERVCEELRSFRGCLAFLCKFDWVPLPLAYPQLIYCAVHVYFLMNLILTQDLPSEAQPPAFPGRWFPKWIPLLTIIQFFFYMGWFKVAMVLINPFGEDDDDFETNYLIDRNMKQGIMIVDDTYDDVPDQKRDQFWGDDVDPLYSEEAVKKDKALSDFVGSAANIGVPNNVSTILMMPRDSFKATPNSPRRISIVDVLHEKSPASSTTCRRKFRSSSQCVESQTELGLRAQSKPNSGEADFNHPNCSSQLSENAHTNGSFTDGLDPPPLVDSSLKQVLHNQDGFGETKAEESDLWLRSK